MQLQSTTVLAPAKIHGVFNGSVGMPSGLTNANYIGITATMNQTDAAKSSNTCQAAMSFSWDGINFVSDPAWTLNWQGGEVAKDGTWVVPSIRISVPVNDQENSPIDIGYHLDTNGNTFTSGLEVVFE